MSDLLNLLQQLMRCPSITPDDAGCQVIIAERLKNSGFHIEQLRYGNVDNLWARYGKKAPLLVFAGHTDVVPPGPIESWHSDPFIPEIREEFLYGRGAADMKSGIACMMIAAEQFIQQHPHFSGSIAFLITSDEEGPSIDGTRKVIEELNHRKEKIDYCIVGEASSEKQIGDQIRIGRRGSLSGKLTIFGKQGHVAFPNLADNPIHRSLSALHDLATEVWDKGNESFPATSFQISNLHAGTGALNVIPGTLEAQFNFRFSTAVTAAELQQRVIKILETYQLNFDLQWNLSAHPFLTKKGRLMTETQSAIRNMLGLETQLSTGGGTSDGRFIAATGAEVIELGPCNASVHQVNEHVRIADLEKLMALYQQIIVQLFQIK